MKKKIVFILLTLLLIGGCNKQAINWHSGQLDDVSFITDNKNIMIEFYTDW